MDDKILTDSFEKYTEYRKKIDAAFIVYGNPRGIIISKLLGAKKIISKPPKFIKFLVSNIPANDKTIIKELKDLKVKLILVI